MSDAERGRADDAREQADGGTGNEEGEQHPAPVGPLEKVATAVSALLVAGLVGVLLWDAVHPKMRPTFTARADSVSVAAASYRVPVVVKNSGDESAKNVVVHLELVTADSSLAESDLTIDWLPGRSTKEIVGFFVRPPSSPRPTGVRADVRGYITP